MMRFPTREADSQQARGVQLPHYVFYNLYTLRGHLEPYVECINEEGSHILAWYSYEIREGF